MEYQTKDIELCLLEGHQKYIDVQYIIEGEEFIGVNSLVDQTPHIPLDIEKDVAFYPGNGYQFKLEAGNFAIFFRTDLHQPCIKVNEPTQVRKVVVKIRANKTF
jgi:YhcH/YjgK/YiaL family protein